MDRGNADTPNFTHVTHSTGNKLFFGKTFETVSVDENAVVGPVRINEDVAVKRQSGDGEPPKCGVYRYRVRLYSEAGRKNRIIFKLQENRITRVTE